MANDYNNEEEIVKIIGDVLKDATNGLNVRLPTVSARYADDIELLPVRDGNFFDTDDDSEWQDFPVVNYYTTSEGMPDQANDILSVPIEIQIDMTIEDKDGSIKTMTKKLRRYGAAIFTCMRDSFLFDVTRSYSIAAHSTQGLLTAPLFTGGDKNFLRDDSGAFLMQKTMTFELRQARG